MYSNRKRVAAAKLAAAGLISVGAAVAFAATAAADDDPPPPAPPVSIDPAAPPPPGPVIPGFGAPLGPAGLDMLAQNGQQANPAALGAPPITGLDQTTILGQNPLPSPPGADPGAIPNLNPFNNGYGVQQCLKPSAPGKCEELASHRATRMRMSAVGSGWAGTSTCTAPGCSKVGCWARCRRNSSVSRCPAPRRRQGPTSRRGSISSSPTRRHLRRRVAYRVGLRRFCRLRRHRADAARRQDTGH